MKVLCSINGNCAGPYKEYEFFFEELPLKQTWVSSFGYTERDCVYCREDKRYAKGESMSEDELAER